MTVYKIRCDVNNFKTLATEDEGIWQTSPLEFDGTSKIAGWAPPEVYCQSPLKKSPDFWYFGTEAAIAVGESALAAVQTMFEMAGELLPLPFEGRKLNLLNVLECINSLDHDKSEWRTMSNGRRLYPTRYVFRPNRFGESSMFKIPEVRTSAIFCYERECDPETEFKAAVEHAKLQGLQFEAVWTDKKRP